MDKFYFNPQFKCFIIDPKLFVLHIFFNKIKNYEKIDFSVFYLKVMQKWKAMKILFKIKILSKSVYVLKKLNKNEKIFI